MVGSANGKFTELFSKVKSINAKHGPFDVLLCTGNFFGKEVTNSDLEKLLNNEIEGMQRKTKGGVIISQLAVTNL